MKKILDNPVCFVINLKEAKKYGLSPLAQLQRNPKAKLLFPKKGKRNVKKGVIKGDGKGKS